MPFPWSRQQEPARRSRWSQTLNSHPEQTLKLTVSRQQEEEEPDGGDTAVRVKYDARLHGARVVGRKEPLTTAFLQKYIQYAKNRYKCARAKAIPWHHSTVRAFLHVLASSGCLDHVTSKALP